MPVNELADAPAAGGQGEGTAETVAEGVAPQAFDINQYGNHVVTVKVDGEDVTVPLSEAVAGYQRQSDYTRKTQSLAAQRAENEFALRLANALENDPAATLELLREHYAPVDQSPVGDEASTAAVTEVLDPRVQQALSWVQAQQQEAAASEIDTILAEQQAAFGDEYNPAEVLKYALDNWSDRKTPKQNFEEAAAVTMFNKVFGKVRAYDESTKTATAEEDRIAAEKRALTTHGGSSAGGPTVPAHGQVNDIRDAFNLALAKHGGL